ncbi:MAG: DUF354 domain-containing protein [Candidatus Geothermarchaeota archaeon]
MRDSRFYKVWIDILTPKQVLFFKGVAEELKERGYEVLMTLRAFRETIGLAKRELMDRFQVNLLGKYGGDTLEGKLLSSVIRMRELTEFIRHERPHIALSYCSPDAARVAFGLNIPHISVSDIPEAVASSKLSVPLSVKLYTPWIIPDRAWTRYGIDRCRIFKYHGLDPLVWLKRHVDDEQLLKDLGLKELKYIVVRPVEEKASYQLEVLRKVHINMKDWISEFIKATDSEFKVFILPRYEDQVMRLKTVFKDVDNVTVIDRVVDGLTLLKYSSGFVGYGGTMTVEAALLGKPTVSVRPGVLPYYLRYLVKRGLVVQLDDESKVPSALLHLRDMESKIFKTAKRLLQTMEDPAAYIANTLSVGL